MASLGPLDRAGHGCPRGLGPAPAKHAHRPPPRKHGPTAWDLRGIERLDHVGAQLLWRHWGRRWPAQLSAGPAQRRVLEPVARFSGAVPARPTPRWHDPLNALGVRLLEAGAHIRGLLALLGQLMLDQRGDLLKAGRFHSYADFTNQPEAGVEDLFDTDLFVELLNGAYKPPTAHAVTKDALMAAAPTPRVVRKAEALFKLMPAAVPVFDHFGASRWLLENPSVLDADSWAVNTTLDRFEEVFKAFNQLLA